MAEEKMMSRMIWFLIFEFKRFFSRKNVVMTLLFFLLVLYFVNTGIDRIKDINSGKEEFQKVERLKFDRYKNDSEWMRHSFKILLIPSGMGILFDNSGFFSILTANIDPGEMLRIYNSYKGKTLYDKRPGGFKDFAGVILLLGSLFAIYYGYESFRYKEFLKLLSSFLAHKIVFGSIFISRIALLISLFLFNTGCALILTVLRGLTLSRSEFGLVGLYLSVMSVLLLFFFILGMLIASFKSKSIATLTIISVWFVFVFFIPGVIDTVVYNKAERITSEFHLESEKLRTMIELEKQTDGQTDDREIKNKSSTAVPGQNRDAVEKYREIKLKLKLIRSLEKRMEYEIRENAKLYHNLSLIFPTTLYLSSCSELSSRGYDSFIDFYVTIQKLQEQFTGFHAEEKYRPNPADPGSAHTNPSGIKSPDTKSSSPGTSAPNPPGFDPFKKGAENIYYAKSRLPKNLWIGLFINSLYLVILFIIAYSRFQNILFHTQKEEIPGLDELTIPLDNGKCTVCVTSSGNIRDIIFAFLSGRGKDVFTGKIEIAGVETPVDRYKQDFVYLCHPGNIPRDIRAGDFLILCRRLLCIPAKDIISIQEELNMKENGWKRFADLKDIEKGNILFSVSRLKKAGLFLINEIERGMPQTYTNKLMNNLQKLKREGVMILYLSSNLYFTAKVSERMIIPADERIENILK